MARSEEFSFFIFSVREFFFSFLRHENNFETRIKFDKRTKLLYLDWLNVEYMCVCVCQLGVCECVYRADRKKCWKKSYFKIIKAFTPLLNSS